VSDRTTYARAIDHEQLEHDRLDWLRSLLEPNVSLDCLWRELNSAHLGGRAADSTVEAVAYALRTDGVSALAANRERLAELSEQQLRDVVVRLRRAQPAYPVIADQLLELLAELLS
jgi:hypothetical protein